MLLVPYYGYASVYLGEHLSFNKTAIALSEAANRALGGHHIQAKIFERVYAVNIYYPILIHVSFRFLIMVPVFGVSEELNGIDRVQEKAVRYFLGVHRFAPIHMLYGDIGWIPCHVQHKSSVIRLWNKVTTSSASGLTSKVFYWDLLYSCICKPPYQ